MSQCSRPVLALYWVLNCVPAVAADNPAREISDLTLQWTGLEHQKDLLQANWRRDRPVLEQQLALLERETLELEALLEESAQQQDEVERKRLELLQDQTRLEQEQAALERSLVQAGNRLRALYPQLPPPLSASWEAEMPRLEDGARTVSEKLQLVLELLGQLDDFQRRITINETVMTLADGQDYLVKQVYLGLSHGWYVTADRRIAAAGMATHQGWRWTPLTDGGPVSRLIAILERRESPALLSIPLQLNRQGD